MESAYALSGFLAGRTGLGDIADVEKLALDPGLIPRLIELSRSPHCEGEVQKMALQCMAAIASEWQANSFPGDSLKRSVAVPPTAFISFSSRWALTRKLFLNVAYVFSFFTNRKAR